MNEEPAVSGRHAFAESLDLRRTRRFGMFCFASLLWTAAVGTHLPHRRNEEPMPSDRECQSLVDWNGIGRDDRQ